MNGFQLVSEAINSSIENELKKSEKNGYERPYPVSYLKKHYPKLLNDPIHMWRAETGIELIHKEPDIEEQNRIWKNWNLMTDLLKRISDKKCLEFFHKTNKKMNESLNNQGNIIITGLSGSGKSTLGLKMSKDKNMKYISIDDEVKDVLNMNLPRDERSKLFASKSVNNAINHLKSSNLKNTILDSAHFIFKEVYDELNKFIKIPGNKLILVDPPIDVVVKQRTKREIERKEKKLGRKLTKEEIEKKKQNSIQLTKDFLPHLKSFKKEFEGKYERISNSL